MPKLTKTDVEKIRGFLNEIDELDDEIVLGIEDRLEINSPKEIYSTIDDALRCTGEMDDGDDSVDPVEIQFLLTDIMKVLDNYRNEKGLF